MNDLSKADYFCPTASDNPYWNESVWFSFSLPKLRQHGFIQYYFRPNMGMLNGGPVMWDASGTQCWNCLYYNWSHLQALPEGALKYAMRANNSLSCKVLEPLKRYAISYDYEDFKFDFEWNAIGPVHELKSGDAAASAAQKFHIEQPGKLTGTLWRDGQAYEVDCYSMRDASYGPRDYTSMTSGGYFWGIAENSAFHAIAKGDGSEQKVIGGFIWKDGELASLASGLRVIEQYSRLGPRSVVFEATDKLGREISARGEIDEGLVFTGYTDHTVVWSLMNWEWQGITYWGDNQEFYPAKRFRRIARGELALGKG